MTAECQGIMQVARRSINSKALQGIELKLS